MSPSRRCAIARGGSPPRCAAWQVAHAESFACHGSVRDTVRGRVAHPARCHDRAAIYPRPRGNAARWSPVRPPDSAVGPPDSRPTAITHAGCAPPLHTAYFPPAISHRNGVRALPPHLPVGAPHSPVAARHTAGALHPVATVPFVYRPRLESAPDAPSPGWNILIQPEQTPVPVDKCNINRKTHPDRMDGIAESKSHTLMRRQRSTLQKSARTRPRRPSPEAFANLRKPRQRNRFRFHDIRRNRIPSRKRLNMVR